jgi:hypothetical protein
MSNLNLVTMLSEETREKLKQLLPDDMQDVIEACHNSEDETFVENVVNNLSDPLRYGAQFFYEYLVETLSCACPECKALATANSEDLEFDFDLLYEDSEF